MAIDPVSLPTAAGVNYGEGDVRHFSEGDEVGVPGLQGPTRHLAERDNQIAIKLNEVIGQVNNREQFISVPVNRIIVPPSSEEIIANFRIPSGYECRVFNATVFSYPASSAIELNIYYSAVVGSNTGESAVSTSSEFYTGTKFYPEGEFILTVKNTGAVTLEMGASVTLTMRPLDDAVIATYQTSVPSVPGPPGPRGTKGDKGDGGSAGAAGAPGLQWKGNWATSTSYAVNDIVRHDFPDTGGTSGMSSYICLISHNSAAAGEPQPSVIDAGFMPFWGYLAQAGEANSGIAFQGAWSSGHGTYYVNDVVTHISGGETSSYICTASHSSSAATEPAVGGGWAAVWAIFATSSAAGINFTGPTSRRGFIQCDKIGGAYDEYVGIPTTGAIPIQVSEHQVNDSTNGLAFIWYQNFVNLPPTSNLAVILPDMTGATHQWLVSEVTFNAIPQVGTILGGGTISVTSPATTYAFNYGGTANFVVKNLSDYALPTTLSLVGIRTF